MLNHCLAHHSANIAYAQGLKQHTSFLCVGLGMIWSATAIILSTVGTGAWHLVSSPGRTFVWSNSYVNSLEVQTFLGLVINHTGHLPTHTIGHEYNQSKYRNRIDKLIANCGRARPACAVNYRSKKFLDF